MNFHLQYTRLHLKINIFGVERCLLQQNRDEINTIIRQKGISLVLSVFCEFAYLIMGLSFTFTSKTLTST